MHCPAALHSSIIQPAYLCQMVCNGVAKYSIMVRRGLVPHTHYYCPSPQIELFLNNSFRQ